MARWKATLQWSGKNEQEKLGLMLCVGILIKGAEITVGLACMERILAAG